MAAQFSSKHIVTSRLAALLVSLAMLAGQGAVTQASADVSLVRSGYTHEALFGIVLEGDHGYAVGMPGLVLRTADQGKTWQPEDMINNGLALLAVTMSGDHAITVGQGGHIFKRTGKAAWTQVESGSKERLLAVDMNASGLAVAAGGFGTHINDVKISASGTITIVGEFGLVMRSQNEGRDWSILHRGEETLFGLFMTKDGHGAAAGQDGTVLISDGWTSDWREVATGRPENLLDIWVGEDGRMVATGIRTLLISNNWGSNWAVVDRKDIATGWYEGVAASGDGPQAVPLAVGYDARILKVGK